MSSSLSTHLDLSQTMIEEAYRLQAQLSSHVTEVSMDQGERSSQLLDELQKKMDQEKDPEKAAAFLKVYQRILQMMQTTSVNNIKKFNATTQESCEANMALNVNLVEHYIGASAQNSILEAKSSLTKQQSK